MRFAFLLYVPRSGSTLFARLAAEQIDNLVVLPEFRMSEWLLSRGESVLRGLAPAELFALMKLDHQRHNLGLSDEDYLAVAHETAGEGVKGVLQGVIQRYLNKRGVSRGPELVIIKLASLLHLLPTVDRCFPEAKFLHVVRDPRAVINSQIHSDRPYFPGEKLGRGDPWFAVKYWHNYLRKVSALRSRGLPIHDVFYENLVSDPEAVLGEVSSTIGLSRDSGEEADAARLPLQILGVEQGIHRRVQQTPQLSRTVAWQSELSMWQGCVVESLAGELMTDMGYEKYYLPQFTAHQKLIALVLGYLGHLLQMLIYYMRRFAYYFTRWRRLWARLRLAGRRVVVGFMSMNKRIP